MSNSRVSLPCSNGPEIAGIVDGTDQEMTGVHSMPPSPEAPLRSGSSRAVVRVGRLSLIRDGSRGSQPKMKDNDHSRRDIAQCFSCRGQKGIVVSQLGPFPFQLKIKRRERLGYNRGVRGGQT
jgi:hypothetical protein